MTSSYLKGQRSRSSSSSSSSGLIWTDLAWSGLWGSTNQNQSGWASGYERLAVKMIKYRNKNYFRPFLFLWSTPVISQTCLNVFSTLITLMPDCFPPAGLSSEAGVMFWIGVHLSISAGAKTESFKITRNDLMTVISMPAVKLCTLCCTCMKGTETMHSGTFCLWPSESPSFLSFPSLPPSLWRKSPPQTEGTIDSDGGEMKCSWAAPLT